MISLKKMVCLWAMLLLPLINVLAQAPAKNTWQWAQIDSLMIHKGLYKTAKKQINTLLAQAKKQQNHSEYIKAIIYTLKVNKRLDKKDALAKNTFVIQREIGAVSAPAVKAILHSLLADLYQQYWEKYNYEITRQLSVYGKDSLLITRWTYHKFKYEQRRQCLLSVKEVEKLKKIPVKNFESILTGAQENRRFRNSLYEFLTYRAIDLLNKAAIAQEHQNIARFTSDPAKYYAPAKEFARLKLSSQDSSSFRLPLLKLLQDLTRYHLKSGNPEALAITTLYRIAYIHPQSDNPDKGKYYLAALRRFEKRYDKYTVSAEAICLRGRHYYNEGMEYKKGNKIKPEHRLKLIKAYKIAQTGFKKFDKGLGKDQNEALINLIRKKNVHVQFEKLLPPNKPFVVSIEYRNTKKLHWRVVKLKKQDIQKIEDYGYYKNRTKIKYLLTLPVYHSRAVSLPNPGDYQPHRIEEKVGGLPSGNYMLMASAKAGFPIKANRIMFNDFTITRLSYIARNLGDNQQEIYVMDRNSGKPLSGVKVSIFELVRDTATKKDVPVLYKNYVTDKNGRVQYPNEKLTWGKSYFIRLKKGRDVFSTQRYNNTSYHRNIYPKKVSDQLKPYFFLDRKIYRPGQTVHFKGVVALYNHRQQKYKTAKPHKALILLRSRRRVIKKLKVEVNEFGSFSGTFKLPKNGMTGAFSLVYAVPGVEQPYKNAKTQKIYRRLSTGKAYSFFSVEEYKRPKFSLNYLPVKGRYRLGQTIAIKGKAKAFSGANISGAKVKYKITRQAVQTNGNYEYFPVKDFAQGETTTNAQGIFTVKIKVLPDAGITAQKQLKFSFEISADVTDLNGETRSKKYGINVGYQDVVIDAKVSESITPALPAVVQLTAVNFDKQPVASHGTVSIYKLRTPTHYHKTRKGEAPDQFNYSKEQWANIFPNEAYSTPAKMEQWEQLETVLKQPYETDSILGNFRLVLPNLASWQQGKYMLVMETPGVNQELIRVKRFFNVQTTTSTQLIVPTADYFVPVKTSSKPDENAQIWLGASQKTWMLLTIEHQGKVVRQYWKQINPGRTLWQIPVKKAYQGNFAVKTAFIKHNRWYSHSQLITVPYANKKLDISFETFRNKLLPGEKEKWRIKIKGSNNTRVAAEMVATLYDASLDAFVSNKFGFDLYPSFRSKLANWNSSHSFEMNSRMKGLQTYGWSPSYTYFYQRDYEKFHWFNYDVSIETEQLMARQDSIYQAEADKNLYYEHVHPMLQQPEVIEAPNEEMLDEEIEVNLDMEFKEEKIFMIAEQSESARFSAIFSKIKARKNFSETAFFYPHLRSDAKGNIMIEFTMPESLTKWKMQGFAHTKDLKYGMISNTLITQKQLMVVPNAPRFFREGDELTLSAKITNLTNKQMNGQSQLKLFDALTNEPIETKLLLSKKQLPFRAKAGQSTAVSWKLKIPVDLQALTYRIVAAAGKFSDGEEMTLPVLTNRTLVTESMPLPINAGQTKRFDFAKLRNSNKSKTLRHHQVTLEFTPNPAWYAVQALPYLMEFPHECAEQTFSRMYANSLAAHIVKANPKIKTVFNAWKNQPPEALLSNLNKNPELKSMLLSETPWVLHAQNTAGRKRRLGLLFDLQRMNNEQQRVVKKLRKMQLANGGWGWFEGMQASRYITQHIVSGLAHLERLGVAVYGTSAMTTQGLKYLDDQIIKDYEEVLATAQKQKEAYLTWFKKLRMTPAKATQIYKAYLGQNQLTHEAIQYLYARSFYDTINLPQKTQTALNFYMKQARQYWLSQSLQTQGMIALAMYRSGFKTTARDIVASLKERSQYSEEMGRYWKQTSGYYWYEAPIETQAIMIEVFDEVTKDAKAVEELKTWLLKQKQTQDWGTTKASTEACYALLMKGTKWLSDENTINITMGGQKIDPRSENALAKVEAGTGYFKMRWKADKVRPEMGDIRVQNQGKTVAWGAVYWQYFEQLDKITRAATPLQLTKTLYLQKNTEAGTVLEPVTAKTKVKVGDLLKVVIHLSTDRPMEYLHLKDMRASGLEPLNVFSRYKYQNGLGYFESTRDAATHFFFDYIPKGKYVFEYPLRVTHAGDFSNGITSIQSMYAPEFSSHSKGVRVKFEK